MCKSAINNANSPLGHNIVYFRNIYGINFSHAICVKKIDHPPRWCEAKRMIVAQLNHLLLVKRGLYNNDGFTMLNINIFIKLLATEWIVHNLYISYVSYVYNFYINYVFLCQCVFDQ